MTLVLLAMMLIVELGPNATGQTLLSKQMQSVAKVFVTRPALMNVPVFALFSGTFGHWGCSAQALQPLSVIAEALAVVANLGQQAGSYLGSST